MLVLFGTAEWFSCCVCKCYDDALSDKTINHLRAHQFHICKKKLKIELAFVGFKPMAIVPRNLV